MLIELIQSFSSNFSPWFNEGTRGNVHSIYRRTINVIVNNELCSIQDENTAISSLSINLKVNAKYFEAIQIQPGDPVVFHSSGIDLGTYFFSLHQASVYDPDVASMIPKLTHTQAEKLKQAIINNMDESDFGRMTRSYFLEQNLPFGLIGNHLYPHIQMLMKPSSIHQATIRAFIGIGNGLTPSGDDFLSGLLAAMTFLPNHPMRDEFKKLVVEIIQYDLPKTTKISAAFLRHAMTGKFSQSVKQLFVHALSNQPYQVQIEKIKQIGHSSGIDFLSGLAFGLEKGGRWV